MAQIKASIWPTSWSPFETETHIKSNHTDRHIERHTCSNRLPSSVSRCCRTLDPEHETLDPKPQTQNPQPQSLNPNLSPLNPHP